MQAREKRWKKSRRPRQHRHVTNEQCPSDLTLALGETSESLISHWRKSEGKCLAQSCTISQAQNSSAGPEPLAKRPAAQPGMGTAVAPSLPSGTLTSAPLQSAFALDHLQMGGQGANEHRQGSPVPGSTPLHESQGSRRKVEKRGLGDLPPRFHCPFRRGLRFPRSQLSQVRGERDHFRAQGLLRPAFHCK